MNVKKMGRQGLNRQSIIRTPTCCNEKTPETQDVRIFKEMVQSDKIRLIIIIERRGQGSFTVGTARLY